MRLLRARAPASVARGACGGGRERTLRTGAGVEPPASVERGGLRFGQGGGREPRWSPGGLRRKPAGSSRRNSPELLRGETLGVPGPMFHPLQ
jgi:hypothetical protein